MSNIHELLKKIALFEKAAINGDRKTFLRSLGQALSPNQMEQLNSALKDFSALGLNTPTVEAPIMSALSGGNFDKKALVAALENGLSGMPRTGHEPQIARIQALISSLKPGTGKLEVPETKIEGDKIQYVPEQTITGKVPSGAMNPSTVKMLQKFLNNALVPSGEWIPIAETGKYDADTIKALKRWGETVGLKGKDLASIVEVAKAHAV